MAWSKQSRRRAELPPNWRKLREQRFQLDGYRCVGRGEDGRRCPARATDCDHIGDKHDHSLENLRSLCADCHKAHTAEQATAALRARRAEISGRFRREEVHPGSIKR